MSKLKAKSELGVKCMGIGPIYLDGWKTNIRKGKYQDFVEESSAIAMLFYREKDKDWINALQKLINFLEDLSDRQILPNVKKYLMDFIEAEIQCVKGEITKKKLMKQREKTINLISKAHMS